MLEWVNFGCPFVRKALWLAEHANSCKRNSLIKVSSGSRSVLPRPESRETKRLMPRRSGLPSSAPPPLPTSLMQTAKWAGFTMRKTTPDMFVVNPEGVLIYAGAIDDKPTPDPVDGCGIK